MTNTISLLFNYRKLLCRLLIACLMLARSFIHSPIYCIFRLIYLFIYLLLYYFILHWLIFNLEIKQSESFSCRA